MVETIHRSQILSYPGDDRVGRLRPYSSAPIGMGDLLRDRLTAGGWTSSTDETPCRMLHTLEREWDMAMHQRARMPWLNPAVPGFQPSCSAAKTGPAGVHYQLQNRAGTHRDPPYRSVEYSKCSFNADAEVNGQMRVLESLPFYIQAHFFRVTLCASFAGGELSGTAPEDRGRAFEKNRQKEAVGLGVTSRMHGQCTWLPRVNPPIPAQGMVESRAVVFPGKGCRQLH